MSRRFPLFLLLVLSAPAFAGVIFEFEASDPSSAEPDVIHTVVDDMNIKIDVKGPHGADADMIYRGGAEREMLAVDHERKSYVLIDEAAMAEIGNQLAGLEAQMQEAMKDMPADQRAMMEEVLKQQMPQGMMGQAAPEPVIEIKKTSEKEDKGGYPSVKHEFYRDGRHEKDFWVTDWKNVEGGREAIAAFEDMALFIQELQDAMPSFAKSDAVGSHAYEHLEELGGFPVVTIDYATDGSVAGESRLISSEIAAIEAGSFDPPAGYVRQDMMP